MANLPEKNITTVSAITSIPSNTNIYVNANGQFRQASINDVVKASNVVSDATLNAMKEFIDNQFQVLTGSPVLAQGTADGYITSFTGKGGSSQKSYSGKNLFGGLEFANALVNSGADATLYTESKIVILQGNSNSKKFEYVGNFKENTQYTIFFRGINDNTDYLNNTNMTVEYTDGSTGSLRFDTSNKQTYFVTDSSKTVAKLKGSFEAGIAKFYYEDFGIQEGVCTLEDFEPYVGAQPSPNPLYPQPIKSKGDMGWFDGELVNGYYSDWHTVVASSNYISNKNKIACKENDDILLVYEESVGSLGIFFYDENNAFISSIKSTLTNELRGVAPANAVYFTFYVNNTNVTTNAKKIVVTINGTYAVKVKSVGKNLIDVVTKDSATSNGVTYSVDKNALVSANGTATGSADVIVPVNNNTLKAGTKYIISLSNRKGTFPSNMRFFPATSAGYQVGGKLELNYDYQLVFTPSEDLPLKSVIIRTYTNYSINGTFNVMIRLAEITDDTYEPYKEHTEWIPLSEPLRGIGDITDTIKATDGLYRGHRKIKEIVFDGSDDELFYLTATNDYGIGNFTYYLSDNDTAVYPKQIMCNALSMQDKPLSVTTTEGIYNNKTQIVFRISLDRASTVEEFKAWLAENPIKVIYELEKEVIEELDQSPFYRLKTFEDVTHISATDDMEMVVEVPTSRAGGVASIGWSKGNLAQIETQNLSAKIAELQTAIVNS